MCQQMLVYIIMYTTFKGCTERNKADMTWHITRHGNKATHLWTLSIMYAGPTHQTHSIKLCIFLSYTYNSPWTVWAQVECNTALTLQFWSSTVHSSRHKWSNDASHVQQTQQQVFKSWLVTCHPSMCIHPCQTHLGGFCAYTTMNKIPYALSLADFVLSLSHYLHYKHACLCSKLWVALSDGTMTSCRSLFSCFSTYRPITTTTTFNCRDSTHTHRLRTAVHIVCTVSHLIWQTYIP